MHLPGDRRSIGSGAIAIEGKQAMIRDVGAALVASAIVLSAPAGADAATPRDTLVIGANLGAFITLDPAAINESVIAGIIRNACDSLVMLSPDDLSKVVPNLAERWETSADGRTTTFHLRAGLKFQSGNPVKASDIVWSMERTAKLGAANSSRLREWGITAQNLSQVMTARDDRTLEVRLPKPVAGSLLPYMFTDFRISPVLDREVVMKHEKDGDLGKAWLATHTACYGPYHITTARPQEVVILQRSDNHWRKDIAMRRVILRHVPEAGAQRLLLEQGDIDIANNIDPADLKSLKANPDLVVQSSPGMGIIYMSLNQKDPVLSQPKVREAFRYLIDYDGLERSVMENLGRKLQSFVINGAFGALPPAERAPFKLDIEKAKRLLAEAGVEPGLTRELITSSAFPYPDIAQHLQANAAKAGINLTVRTMASSQLFGLHRARDFAVYLAGYGFNYPDANNMFLRFVYVPDVRDEAKNTISVGWRASWDPGEAVNKLGLAAQVEQDTAKREQMYQQLQRDVMLTNPSIYLFQNNSLSVHRKNVSTSANSVQQLYWTTSKH
jgi:peptide/nickel transport system substrate-binding protein